MEPQSPVYVYKALLLVTRDGDLAGALEAIKEGINRAGVEDMAVWTPQCRSRRRAVEACSTHGAAVDQVGIEQFGPDSAAYYLAQGAPLSVRGDARGPRRTSTRQPWCWKEEAAPRPDDPKLRAKLASAYAGLGRREPAIREGRRAVELSPPSKDTSLGVDMVRNLAVVYATLGEADSAVQQLRLLLAGSLVDFGAGAPSGSDVGSDPAGPGISGAGRWGEARRGVALR